MFFLIRFTYFAVLLILVQLLIPRFNPGGRFLILLSAAVTGFLVTLFRKTASGKIPKLLQAFLSGISIVIALLFLGYYFSRVKLNFLGILVSYCGVIPLELLLPNEWYELIYQKYCKKD